MGVGFVQHVQRLHARQVGGEMVAQKIVNRQDLVAAQWRLVGGGIFAGIAEAADHHRSSGHQEGDGLILRAGEKMDDGFFGILGSIFANLMVKKVKSIC